MKDTWIIIVSWILGVVLNADQYGAARSDYHLHHYFLLNKWIAKERLEIISDTGQSIFGIWFIMMSHASSKRVSWINSLLWGFNVSNNYLYAVSYLNLSWSINNSLKYYFNIKTASSVIFCICYYFFSRFFCFIIGSLLFMLS